MPATEPEMGLAERLLYTTLRITSLANGQVTSRGTGFFYNFINKEGQAIPAIVTNKHVVSASDTISVMCHLEDDGQPSGDFIECQVSSSFAVHHPAQHVDLCAVLLGPTLGEASKKEAPIYYRGLNKDSVPPIETWTDFSAIENVTMIGCPRGIIDEYNNLPIVRRGITATPLWKDYENRPEFMVDMACFPGSSGSPVFILDQGTYMDGKTGNVTVGTRFFLVGILYAGPTFSSEGKIVMMQQPTVEIASMMHLGSVVKATELDVIQNELQKKLDN